jgi:hypothetical protein
VQVVVTASVRAGPTSAVDGHSLSLSQAIAGSALASAPSLRRHKTTPALVLPVSSLALFAFWLRSSVVSVLFSLIAKTTLRGHSRLSLFLYSVDDSLGLLIVVDTVSPVSHYLRCTRLFIETTGLPVA